MVMDGMDGAWHDDRWREYAERTGGPKVVFTSRLVPADPPRNPKIEPVHPLSPVDSVLLAREVQGADASLMLRGGEGHPLLPAGQTGHRTLIAAWVEGAAASLPEEARILFRFLCSLEETDRDAGPIVTSIWEDVCEAFGGQGEAPGLDRALDALARSGLAEVVRDPAIENAVRSVLMHPVTFEVGRGLLTGEEYEAVTGVVAAFWWFCIQQSRREENSRMVLGAVGGPGEGPFRAAVEPVPAQVEEEVLRAVRHQWYGGEGQCAAGPRTRGPAAEEEGPEAEHGGQRQAKGTSLESDVSGCAPECAPCTHGSETESRFTRAHGSECGCPVAALSRRTDACGIGPARCFSCVAHRRVITSPRTSPSPRVPSSTAQVECSRSHR